jgi:hypothetical protein
MYTNRIDAFRSANETGPNQASEADCTPRLELLVECDASSLSCQLPLWLGRRKPLAPTE